MEAQKNEGLHPEIVCNLVDTFKIGVCHGIPFLPYTMVSIIMLERGKSLS